MADRRRGFWGRRPGRTAGQDGAALDRARLALEGLSVGDAFGETFFTSHEVVAERVRTRVPPPGPWRWTDDTAMAISVVDELAAHGRIDQDRLARRFADRHRLEPARGYGAGAHEVLQAVGEGEPWRTAARRLFGGQGSLGNGAAMRVAPVGAWFADDPSRAATEARRSAEVTHAHPEGIAGAVAVAVAAAWLWRTREAPWDGPAWFAQVLDATPPGATRDGIERAAALPRATPIGEAATLLGNGRRVSASDTVPLALWSVAVDPGTFEGCLWRTATALGDVDTTCAIVGGLVVLRTGLAGIPADWLGRREPLPRS